MLPGAQTGADGRLGTLDTMDATTLFEAESSAALASGHLLLNQSGTLMAQGFDATSHRFTGDAFPVMEHIGSEGSRYASFSVSDRVSLSPRMNSRDRRRA